MDNFISPKISQSSAVEACSGSQVSARTPYFKRKPILKTVLFLTMFFLWSCIGAWAAHAESAKDIIENQCSSCHKFEGKHESKFNLKGPDLMWGGNKYQRPWLIRWLTGKEENLYPNGYRWDISRDQIKHPVLSETHANDLADYFEKHVRDSRIEKSFVDLSTFTEQEAQFGAVIFKQYSCIGCHQIKEDGKKIGGPISANLYDSGNRYNLDWWTAFAANPQNFTPHSGEYLADISMLGARYIIGYLMTLGVDDFKYFEPWNAEPFQKADVKRGATVYRQYCVQCHGAKGEGDGPGADGLTPKPAVHAKMALNDFPIDYLYNLVYHGGKTVGKSPNMPDWGMTIGEQGVADVITYMRATFKGGEKMASVTGKKAKGDCPQKRNTKEVSFKYKNKKNPLKATPANLKAGEALYQKTAKPMACKLCHGKRGDGKGPGAAGIRPAPRNFTCSATMKDISDGQMFGVIKAGSPGTAMPAFKNLKDKQVWQVIHYIRQLAKL
jgi:mono/diheme cytochrome c family protein